MDHTDEKQEVFEQLNLSDCKEYSIKDALASLRKFVEAESPLKMVRNAFHLKYFSRSHDV